MSLYSEIENIIGMHDLGHADADMLHSDIMAAIDKSSKFKLQLPEGLDKNTAIIYPEYVMVQRNCGTLQEAVCLGKVSEEDKDLYIELQNIEFGVAGKVIAHDGDKITNFQILSVSLLNKPSKGLKEALKLVK